MNSKNILSNSKLTAICFILSFCFACTQTPSSHEEQLQQTIQEDLENSIPSEATLSLNLPNLPTTIYHSDKAHSSISFRTSHWEIVDLVGWFGDFEVVMYADESDFTDAVIYAEVYLSSIHMPNPKMEGSARQAPYLDTEQYPVASFMSEEMKQGKDGSLLLLGKLTINGIEKETPFDVQFNGFAYPQEKSICGFTAVGTINRHDFLAIGDDLLHSGKKVHGDSIEIRISVRME